MNYRAVENELSGRQALAARLPWSKRQAGAAFGGPSGALLALALSFSPASADVGATKCGAPIGSTVKQGINVQQTITATNTFGNVGGAGIAVNVPAGQTRCVRVRFSANVLCDPPSGADHCYVKVTEDLAPLVWDPAIAIATSEGGGAHSYEWATRLGAGKHTIRMQATKNTGVTFIVIHWTMAVDVAQ